MEHSLMLVSYIVLVYKFQAAPTPERALIALVVSS